MYYGLALVLSISLFACASDGRTLTEPLEMMPSAGPFDSDKAAAIPGTIVKSSQGLVVNGPKGVFGGFIGDCSSDENFPYYWECQAESAGDSFH